MLLAALAAGLGCAANRGDPEAATLPTDVRADYAVFALRCSKCHSLARPLNSGIDDDEYWKMYVERMRRQPASGISVADTVPILRFLHVFSIAERKRKEQLQGGLTSDASLLDGGALPEAGPP